MKQFQATFTSPHGEAVLANLMKDAGVFEQTFNSDPLLMSFAEGQRAVVLRILKILKFDIQKAEKLIKEQEEKMEDHNA